jgi:hypothetical protein
VWLASLSIGLSVERFVPGGGALIYSNIQSAINASLKGDIIRVQPGIYRESITFRSVDITLTSINPNDLNVVQTTIIEGDGTESVVNFGSGQSTNTVFTGFTVRGGGGTIYASFYLLGGGLNCNQSSPSIVRNIIERNYLSTNRLGMFSAGGAISCWNSSPRISRNVIRNNSADVGGAIHSLSGKPLIQDNWIYNNIGQFGGAVYLADEGKFLNNTLVGNAPLTMYVDQTGLVANNIIADFSPAIGVSGSGSPESLSWFKYNDVWELGGTEVLLFSPSGTNIVTSLAGMNGNLSIDPLFIDSTNFDLHLSAPSPCINAGDLLGLRTTNELDFDGASRIFALRVDMGGSEFNGFRNFPPIANAGPDQIIAGWTGGRVLLDAAGSIDPEGTALSFRWSQTTGSPVVLFTTNSQAFFTPPSPGEYHFDLVVSDGVNESPADSVRIVVTNLPPIASAGESQSLVLVPEVLLLNGSHSLDPEGQPLVYHWRQTGGPSVPFLTAGSPRPAVRPPGPGVYEFELTVSDQFNTSPPDSVRFYLGQVPPVANAGPIRYAGRIPITLDGSGSFAPNNSAPLEYAWRVVSGPPLTLTPTNVANPTVRDFSQATTNREAVFELVVSAGGLTSAPVTVKMVIVRAWSNPRFSQLNPPFKTNLPTVFGFGGGDCNGGGLVTFNSRWFTRANLFTDSYARDSSSSLSDPRYFGYGDQLIVLLSALAPGYDQPIQTLGNSTGGMPACDVAEAFNIVYQDPRYLVNRMTFLDVACGRDYDSNLSNLASNRIPGKMFWVDNYYSEGSFHAGTLNVQFPTPPAGHLTPGDWYYDDTQSWITGTPYSPSNFNNGIYAGGFFSPIGPGKNYQLETGQSEYYFGWNTTNRFPVGALVQKEPFRYPARLPGVIEITGPTNGTLATEGSVVFSCRPVVNAAKYEILVGRDPKNVNQIAWQGSVPPEQPLLKLPFLKTWWTIRATDAWGTTSWADSRSILRANGAPIADASATAQRVVVPLSCTPKIVLDGSRSWDPDNDLLDYAWFKSGDVSAFATGVVAIATLPLGVNSLVLAVNDGVVTNTQLFQVEIISSAKAIEDLIGLVDSQATATKPLIASLHAAIASLDRGQENSAINQLESFEQKVRVQVERSDPLLADRLNLAADAIIGVLRLDCSSVQPHGQIAKASHNQDGNALIEFSGPKGLIYIIEFSTNLVDWKKIGVARNIDSDEFQFEDANSSQTTTRFYRVVVP